jgi:glycosyltransferase involved in cell wall biosynthesis
VVQAISNFLGAWARRRGFKGYLEIIPNGVDTKRFLGDPIPHKGTILITASRLVHKNAIDDVIRALQLLPAHIRFEILGVGPDEGVLKKLAKDLGISTRVVWKGFVDHKDLPRHLHAADIFIRPSRSEGMGNSFIEAMAAGVPVIATQEGGLADFIFDEKTAFVVEKDSPHQIAQKVEKILGNSELVKKVVDDARALAIKMYDWDIITRDMREKVFSRLFV